MNPRRRLTIVTGGVGMAVLAIACFVAKDKLVEQWYLWKLRSGDEHEQRTAVQHLGELRSVAAVPELLALFRTKNRSRSFSPDDQHLRRALVKIGEPAVPGLIELSRDHRSSVRSAAWSVVGSMGPAAVPHLAETLEQEDETLRAKALLDLGGLDSRIGALVPRLVEAYADESPEVRAAALSAIIGVGRESSEGLRTLLKALEDEDKRVRLKAALHLGSLEAPRAKTHSLPFS